MFHRPSCTDKIRDNCLSAPRPISSSPPTYSEEARKAKVEGDCIVSLVVDEKGNLTNLHVVSGLGMGLDEKAIEAIKKWKFEPAFRDGKPVAAKLTVQVSFHL
jgi:protein TonB